MSADNWDICPCCKRKAEAEHQELVRQVAESYGKIPIEEFDDLRTRAAEGVDYERLRTFREDYEFYGADDGVVTASYSGHCKTCGTGVDFKHEVPIPGVRP